MNLIFAAGIHNSYRNDPCGEKILFTCGREFGLEHKGNTTVVVQALYGLRSQEVPQVWCGGTYLGRRSVQNWQEK